MRGSVTARGLHRRDGHALPASVMCVQRSIERLDLPVALGVHQFVAHLCACDRRVGLRDLCARQLLHARLRCARRLCMRERGYRQHDCDACAALEYPHLVSPVRPRGPGYRSWPEAVTVPASNRVATREARIEARLSPNIRMKMKKCLTGDVELSASIFI